MLALSILTSFLSLVLLRSRFHFAEGKARDVEKIEIIQEKVQDNNKSEVCCPYDNQRFIVLRLMDVDTDSQLASSNKSATIAPRAYRAISE